MTQNSLQNRRAKATRAAGYKNDQQPQASVLFVSASVISKLWLPPDATASFHHQTTLSCKIFVFPLATLSLTRKYFPAGGAFLSAAAAVCVKKRFKDVSF